MGSHTEPKVLESSPELGSGWIGAVPRQPLEAAWRRLLTASSSLLVSSMWVLVSRDVIPLLPCEPLDEGYGTGTGTLLNRG